MNKPKPLNEYFNILSAEVGDRVRVTKGGDTGKTGEVRSFRHGGILPVIVEFRTPKGELWYGSYEFDWLEWAF